MSDSESSSRGFLVGLLIAGAAVIAGTVWWTNDAKVDLHAGMKLPPPGAEAAAGPAQAQAPAPKPPEPPWLKERREAAEKALQANPDDLDALNMLTQIHLPEPEKAMAYNQRALEVGPEDPDALTLQAVLASMVGMHDRALEKLDAVLAAHPEHPRALTYKGLVCIEAGRYDEAIVAIERAMELLGSDPGLQAALQNAKARKAGNVPGAESQPPSPEAAHHGEAGPTAGAEPVAGGDLVVSGMIDIDPAKASTPGTAVYVSVRDPAGGPPLAALRLPPGPFPMGFRVTSKDAIAMGGAPRPFPPLVDVSIRLDQDGNAMTKADGEPQASLSGAAKGSNGLTVTLR